MVQVFQVSTLVMQKAKPRSMATYRDRDLISMRKKYIKQCLLNIRSSCFITQWSFYLITRGIQRQADEYHRSYKNDSWIGQKIRLYDLWDTLQQMSLLFLPHLTPEEKYICFSICGPLQSKQSEFRIISMPLHIKESESEQWFNAKRKGFGDNVKGVTNTLCGFRKCPWIFLNLSLFRILISVLEGIPKQFTVNDIVGTHPNLNSLSARSRI